MNRQVVLTLAGLFLLALTLRLAVLYERADSPGFEVPIVDAGVYDQMARQLLAGEDAEPRMFWQPIFYPLYLSTVYWLTDGSIFAVKILQALLGALTCCLTFLVALQLADRRTGLVAGGITALYGPLILFEGELLAASWAAFWSVALVGLFTLASRARAEAWIRSRWALGLGVSGAIAVLTRPSFLPFYAIAWLWLLWRWRGSGGQRLASPAAAAIVGFATLALPVAIASQNVTGHFGLLPGSGGLNSYIGNNPSTCETLSVRPGDAWGELIDLPARHGATGYAERNRYFYGQVLEYFRDQPFDFVAGLGAKALRFASSRELPRNIDIYFSRGESRLLSGLSWKWGTFGFPFGLVLPLAILGIINGWRRLGAPLLLFLALYPTAVVLVFVTARYRVPIVPVLAIPAAMGIFELARVVAGRGKPLAVASAVLVVAALLVTLPGPFCEEALNMEADFYYCLAFAQAERDDPAGAITHYQRALESDPDLEHVHYNLGLLYAAQDELPQAIDHYRQALELDPDHARAHNNLGSVYQRQGKMEDAVAHFTSATRGDPELLPAQRNLAKSLLGLGRSQEALAQIDILGDLLAKTGEPEASEIAFLRGGAYLQTGELERAAAALRQAAAADPRNAKVANDLGTALLGMRDFAGALEQFERAIELSPDHLQAYNNAGAVMAMTGDLEGARKHFDEAVRRAPEYADARYNLATVLLRQGQVERAVQELQQVLRIQPNHPRAGQRLQELMGDGSRRPAGS